MHFFLWITAFFLFLVFRSVLSTTNRSNCHYSLQVTNDGPVTLDVPVTVSAFLECADKASEYMYTFEDDTHRMVRLVNHDSAMTDFIFSDHVGNRTIQVKVYLFTHPLFLVASKKTILRVGEHIFGTLNFTDVIEDEDGFKYLGTGREINITVELQYPARVLRDSEFAYSWTIGEQHFSTDHPYKVHTFLDDGPYWVRVATVGRVPSYDGTDQYRYKWGYFNNEVTVKDPFPSINISGNTYLEHGQLLDLDISCNGSGPIEYCWKIMPPKESKTNLSCTDPVTTTECTFPILYYFRDSGDYLLAIYINNWVTTMQRNVKVHIYDVSLRPQLSTVIIPVSCTILVVLIIAIALLLHMRRHFDYDVETADFDFMAVEENSTVAIETSWEIMRRSLIHLIQLRCLFYSTDQSQTGINYGAILVNVERQA